MAHGGNRKTGKRSLLHPLWRRLSQRIAPQVRGELAAALGVELGRHFNEHLRAQLNDQVKAIVAQELEAQVASIIARDLPRQLEAIIARDLPGQVEQLTEPARSRQQAEMYRLNQIVAGSVAGDYMRASNALARDFLHPEYLEFSRLSNTPVHLHRKFWEWAFIYQRLRQAGVLRPGMRGLVFGVGAEKLPSFFAKLGAGITATDAPIGQNWNLGGEPSDQKTALFDPAIIDRQSFDERVSFEHCDMNDIPGHLRDYDFCWSSCCFEHLGSLQNGIDFVVNSVERTLKVGGVAVHTTEFNLSSDEDTLDSGVTVVYRKRDLERLRRILEERGHWVEPLRIEPGDLPPDYFVDLPPYGSDPHLKLRIGAYVTTSVGLMARRGR
jgi:SAM-dependent methyltransferase